MTAIRCAICGHSLTHINEACPTCLPGFNSAMIGGTHLCKHSHMAVICRECAAEKAGAEAERSRIVALLREPDIDRRIAQATYYMPSSYTRAVCAALADLIESQQQGGGE